MVAPEVETLRKHETMHVSNGGEAVEDTESIISLVLLDGAKGPSSKGKASSVKEQPGGGATELA